MDQKKLSWDEVPIKFTEWLLSMGCPQETVPPIDKISEMCRGQYYMVWRSLMEHVGPKDVIKMKRLQVFIDNVTECQKQNVLQKNNRNVVIPEELSLWLEQRDLKQKKIDAEARVLDKKENIQQIANKVSSKLAQYKLAKKKLQDGQRRVWLLQQLAEFELREKKAKLIETKAIADSLNFVDDDGNIESKLAKCIESLSRQTNRSNVGGASSLVANPVACSSIASTTNDNIDAVEEISSLVQCRGDAVFKQLYERRAGLCASVVTSRTTNDTIKRKSPQSVLAETAGLHCTLALETMKNRAQIKKSKNKLTTAVAELSSHLSGEACELLVIQCERARAEASINCLKNLTEDLIKWQGVFAMDPVRNEVANLERQIHIADKNIVSKRDELKRLITTASTIERKTQNARDCLLNLFNSFHQESPKIDHYAGPPTSMPQESLSTIRQFYEEKREELKPKMELSMDLDASDSLSFDTLDGGIPKFSDELKYYLKHFNLEKNRKLVLESGEKIWIFDTVQSSFYNLLAKLVNQEHKSIPLSPIEDLKGNLSRLIKEVEFKRQLDMMVKEIKIFKTRSLDIDINSKIEEEHRLTDKIKKKLNDNINNLQRTDKNLDIVMENLKFWSENHIRKYISSNRKFEGKSFKEIEASYVESFL